MSAARVPLDEIWVCHLGLIPYSDGIALQETLRERRLAGTIPDTLLLLEHPPTYTRGRRSGAEDLSMPESFYAEKGIDVFATDRGGKVTYHGPGQLVGYPIMAVHDVVRHVRSMEAAIVAALAPLGIPAHGRPDDGPNYTGVWVGPAGSASSAGAPADQCKIASIGVHVRHGVSTHGFAVNVHNDLQPFSWVTACGLPDVVMTSVAAETARAAAGSLEDARAAGSPEVASDTCESLACFRKRMAHAFCLTHGARQRLVSPQRLGIDTANPSYIKTSCSPVTELTLA
jgi:lipoyl(octanoyl) transferase